ncbi:hypothetical protein D3C85_1289060 [compost metagenome]
MGHIVVHILVLVGEDFDVQLLGGTFADMDLELSAFILQLNQIFEIELLQLERRCSEV